MVSLTSLSSIDATAQGCAGSTDRLNNIDYFDCVRCCPNIWRKLSREASEKGKSLILLSYFMKQMRAIEQRYRIYNVFRPRRFGSGPIWDDECRRRSAKRNKRCTWSGKDRKYIDHELIIKLL